MKKSVTALLLVLLLCFACMTSAETVVGDPMARFRANDIEYEGKTYRPRSRLTTTLVIGTDRYAEEMPSLSYRSGVQADFLLLLVVDDAAETITPVQINRDSMIGVDTYSLFGADTGRRESQICLSYSFGDGRETSCALTKDAVSRLLSGAKIDYTLALNLDAIPVLNDALGGVTVTLEDDFTVYDPAMTAGTTLTLRGKQAEYYLRMRYFVGDTTNALRLERQKNYLACAAPLLRDRMGESGRFLNELMDSVEPYLVTDMARGFLINLGNRARLYEILPTRTLEGETVTGADGHVEFYPDEAALRQLVFDVFYTVVP